MSLESVTEIFLLRRKAARCERTSNIRLRGMKGTPLDPILYVEMVLMWSNIQQTRDLSPRFDEIALLRD